MNKKTKIRWFERKHIRIRNTSKPFVALELRWQQECIWITRVLTSIRLKRTAANSLGSEHI